MIGDRMDKIIAELRKKNNTKFLEHYLPKLQDLGKEISRNLDRCVKQKSHTIHYDDGQLRIMATLLRNLVNKYSKSIYYESYETTIDTLDKFEEESKQKVKYLEILYKLIDLHFTFSHSAITCKLVIKNNEKQKEE